MKILRSLALLSCLFICHASSAATLAVLQKNGEVYSMSADSESSVSHPKKIAQLPAEGLEFVTACGSPGLLYALRADGVVFTVSPEGKVDPFEVNGWEDRVSLMVFQDGNLYGMDRNLDRRSNPQIRILDQGGSTVLELRMTNPESARDFAISGQGNPVFLSAPDRPWDETYPQVTWAYAFPFGYRGDVAGHTKFLNFSNRLPGILVRARGGDMHAVSEKQDTGESLWHVIHADQTDQPLRISTSDAIPLNVLDLEFSRGKAVFLFRSEDGVELTVFQLSDDNRADLVFRATPPVKDVVGMGVLD